MDITEVSMIHHVCIVLVGLCLLSQYQLCHPAVFLVSLIYLCLVHERYIMRMRRKIQSEERKQSSQRRVLTDSETVRWLNYAMQKIWPICMERICSETFLLPLAPWFLDKFKPWNVKKASLMHLYLGRACPMITEVRVIRQSSNDDDVVLQLGVNFLAADDMSAILAVKMGKRLGFGMSTKLHLTGIHLEGKVLVGLKFIRSWPFLGRIRICFAEPPYCQLTLKPLSPYGLDFMEFPGIAGWLDKLLSNALEETLVEPNMLVVDVEKLTAPQQTDAPEQGTWFSMDVKEPVAYVRVEIIEGLDLKPLDLNGLATPYVKGQLGPYRFKTEAEKKKLAPKWHEEFKVPIITWESPNLLTLEVFSQDKLVSFGSCSVNINNLRDGQRHEMWLSLQNAGTGRLHLGITVLEAKEKGDSHSFVESISREYTDKDAFSSSLSEKHPEVKEIYEPIDINGKKETGVWIHQPGSQVSETWEPRKGKNSRQDVSIKREQNPAATEYRMSGSSGSEESQDDKYSRNLIWRGLGKLGLKSRRAKICEDQPYIIREAILSPLTNIKAVNSKHIEVNFSVEGGIQGTVHAPGPKEVP